MYPSYFSENVTSIPGYFYVTVVPQRNDSIIPPPWVYADTVVATSGTSTPTGQYEWVIELQCYQDHGFVNYIGINFYCYKPNPSDQMKNDMIQTALQQVLGPYLDQRIFRTANQTNCTYPPPPV